MLVEKVGPGLLCFCVWWLSSCASVDGVRDSKTAWGTDLSDTVQAGDVYFGRFQEKSADGMPVRFGYAWFKVSAVQGDTVMVALGKETTGNSDLAADLSRTAFEAESHATLIREQDERMIDFREVGNLMFFIAIGKDNSQ